MLRAGYDAAQTPQPDPPFGPADDQYVFQFVYVLDGLPVFSESKEEDNVIWRNTLANPVMSAYKGQVYVNREGVYALYVDHPELGQAGEQMCIRDSPWSWLSSVQSMKRRHSSIFSRSSK